MKRIEEVRAISWRGCAELRFLSADGSSVDAREVTEWDPRSANMLEVDRADGLRREAFRIAVGALTDVAPSIVDGTSPYRSLVAEFDRDAGALDAEFGRDRDGSAAQEWSLDLQDLQTYAMQRHLVMHYACTKDSSAERLSRLDATAGRSDHQREMEELVSDGRVLGQQVTSYRARERVARDGWVVERLEGAVADAVAVVESERLAMAYVDVLNGCAQVAPSGALGARTEVLMFAAAKARLSAALPGTGGAPRALLSTPSAQLGGPIAGPLQSASTGARQRGRG